MMTPVTQPKVCSVENYVPPVAETIQKDYKQFNSGEVLKKVPSNLGTNCVAYARSKTDLPQNLYTLSDKVKHIKTQKPTKGAVGVTAESGSGHLVIVQEIKNNGETIIVSEGNFIHGFVTIRAVPASLLLGYY